MAIGVLFLELLQEQIEELLERRLRRFGDAGGIRIEVLPLDRAGHHQRLVQVFVEAGLSLDLLLFVMMVVVLFILLGLRGLALDAVFENHFFPDSTIC